MGIKETQSVYGFLCDSLKLLATKWKAVLKSPFFKILLLHQTRPVASHHK